MATVAPKKLIKVSNFEVAVFQVVPPFEPLRQLLLLKNVTFVASSLHASLALETFLRKIEALYFSPFICQKFLCFRHGVFCLFLFCTLCAGNNTLRQMKQRKILIS